jgi:hypothetical protein
VSINFYKVQFGTRKSGTEEVHGNGWNGWRIVWVSSQTKRDTWLRNPMTGDTAKLRTSIWDSLNPQPHGFNRKYLPQWWRNNAPVAWLKMEKEASL